MSLAHRIVEDGHDRGHLVPKNTIVQAPVMMGLTACAGEVADKKTSSKKNMLSS